MRRFLAAVFVTTLAAPVTAQINWNARTPWNDLRPNIARGDWEAQKKAPFQIFDHGAPYRALSPGELAMPRPAIATHEEGAYRQYSTDEERRQTGWIGGQKREVILDRALKRVSGLKS